MYPQTWTLYVPAARLFATTVSCGLLPSLLWISVPSGPTTVRIRSLVLGSGLAGVQLIWKVNTAFMVLYAPAGTLIVTACSSTGDVETGAQSLAGFVPTPAVPVHESVTVAPTVAGTVVELVG